MIEIEWGPEIPVDGVRPDFVSDDDLVCYTFGAPHGRGMRAASWAFDGDGNYYLLADHPHYATQQPRTAPSGGEVGAEITLTAEQAQMFRGVLCFVFARQGPFAAEAARCLDLLPEPVDPDEAEAQHLAEEGPCNRVEVILAAIRRGRALEKEAGR